MLIIRDLNKVNLKNLPPFINEIKVLSPSSFRVEVYPNDEDFEENYIAKSYFNNTLLDDNVTVNTEAGYIYLYIPQEIYNTIKNQLPPHKTTANPSVDNTIGVMIRDINKVNIIYKEDPLNEIIVNKPGKPFKFVVTKKNTIVSKDARKGELYFKGKLIDDDAYFDGKWIIAYVDFDQENLQKDIEPYISPLIESQFPSFYREDGTKFITFIKSYYEWLEQSNNVLYQTRKLL
jgi:hypothetical protein